MKAWLDVMAKDIIETEAKRRHFVETGGPLFGYFCEEPDELVIVAAFGPGPRAKHRPRSLVPDRAATELVITDVHERSQGRYRYIGSWHTHPFGLARPSAIDSTTAGDISAQESVALEQPLLLIQATRPTPRMVRIGRLRAFQWNATSRSLDPVELLEVVDLVDRLLCSSTEARPR